MKILISQRIGKDKHGEYFDYLENNYIDFFEKFNITPILLPNKIKDIIRFFKKNNCQRIILTGGENINPKLYRKKITSKPKYHYIRDRNEITLIKLSIKEKIPLLALCRGFQLVNIYFGGKLDINIDKTSLKHKEKKHKLKLIEPFAKIFRKKSFTVNSYHKQGVSVKNIAKCLTPMAITKDNRLIELYKHIDLPIIGVQWHLERKSYSKNIDNIIFRNFLKNKKI